MKSKVTAALMTGAFALAASPALAQSQGDLTLGIGAAHIETDSDSGSLASGTGRVLNGQSITFTLEYFVRDNIGIELLAATPFEHDITVGGAPFGSTKHLPPTLSLNYHFPTGTAWKPYVGAGINYTFFFDEEPNGLDLDSSFGFAVQAGLDYQLTPSDALRLNVRYIDIDSDAELNGTDIGTAQIDPVVIGIGYVHKF